MSDQALVEFRNVSRQIADAGLRAVNASLSCGRIHWITGDATADLFLRVATLLEATDSGELIVAGESTGELDETNRTRLRTRRFGFVFASPYLLPAMCAAENIAMPLFKLSDFDEEQVQARTREALDLTDLGNLATTEVGGLSRFDQHRVAIARAVAHHPSALVLERADAGLADGETEQLVALTRRIVRDVGISAMILADRTTSPEGSDGLWTLQAGQLVESPVSATPPSGPEL